MLRSPEFFSARSFCAPQDKDYAATGGEGYSIPGKRGEVLTDEIAQEIVSELRLGIGVFRTSMVIITRSSILGAARV